MTVEDSGLVERLTQGDNGAWRKLFRDNTMMITGMGYRRGVSEQDIEEVIQETMTIAYTNISKFMNRSLLSTWVYSIARNCYRSQLRTSIKLRQKKERYGVHTKVQGTDTDGQVLRQLEARSAWSDIRNRIYYCNSPAHYETLCKRIEGYRFYEIAGKMDCPVSTAGSRMQSAKNNIQELNLLQ